MRRALEIPNTGMAVLYDIGEAKDIHPHNKMDGGKRFSLLALKNDYGFDEIVASGPLYSGYTVKKGEIVIRFEEVGSGMIVGNKELTNDVEELDAPFARF